MIHPTGQRENQRYRGPVESSKIDNLHRDILLNLEMLESNLDKMEKLLGETKSIIASRGKMYEAYDKIKLISEVE